MTAQIKDYCVYLGEEYRLLNEVVIPAGNPHIVTLTGDERVQAEQNSIAFSTACWRNYIAKWVIEDGKLYLTDIEGIYRLDGKAPLFADWFNGELCLPHGELLEMDFELDFTLRYAQQRVLKFAAGVLLEDAIEELDCY